MMSEVNQPIHNQNDSQFQMKSDVKDALCGARAFYFCMHAFVFGLCSIYDNDLKDQVINGEYTNPLIFIILIVLSTYLFWNSGKNPGYAPYELDVEMQNPYNRDLSRTGAQNNNDTESRQNQQQDNIDDHSNKSERSSTKYEVVMPQNSLALGGSLEQQGSNDDERKSNENVYSNFDQVYDKNNKYEPNMNKILTPKIGKRHSDDVIHSSHSHSVIPNVNNDYRRISNQDDDGIFTNTKHSSGPKNKSASDLSQDLRNDFPPENNSSQQDETNPERQSRNTNQESEQNEQLDAVAQLFYCSICKRHQPFRSKHCFKCGRCICKFDHHCFWIGGCVGELNHRKFWIFLFFQTATLIWAFMNSLDALDRFIVIDENGSESYSQEYGAFAVLCFVLFLFILFTGILWGFHTFLILTNQTTWEHDRRSKISFLSKMPKGFYPFSKGIYQNIKDVFFHNNKLREWQVPTLREAQILHKNTFNICQNEYYNCC